MPYCRKTVTQQTERIPRRPPPDYEESEEGMMGAISDAGFLSVALNDANQYNGDVAGNICITDRTGPSSIDGSLVQHSARSSYRFVYDTPTVTQMAFRAK